SIFWRDFAHEANKFTQLRNQLVRCHTSTHQPVSDKREYIPNEMIVYLIPQFQILVAYFQFAKLREHAKVLDHYGKCGSRQYHFQKMNADHHDKGFDLKRFIGMVVHYTKYRQYVIDNPIGIRDDQ